VIEFVHALLSSLFERITFGQFVSTVSTAG